MESLINDSSVTDDEVIDMPGTVPINSNYKKEHINWIILFFTLLY